MTQTVARKQRIHRHFAEQTMQCALRYMRTGPPVGPVLITEVRLAWTMCLLFVMHAVCITHRMCPSSMENEPSYARMLSTPHHAVVALLAPYPSAHPRRTPAGTRFPRSETSVIECLLGR